VVDMNSSLPSVYPSHQPPPLVRAQPQNVQHHPLACAHILPGLSCDGRVHANNSQQATAQHVPTLNPEDDVKGPNKTAGSDLHMHRSHSYSTEV
jgi:hypothetical protein